MSPISPIDIIVGAINWTVWAFQQWPEVPIFVIQYDEPDQLPQDAQILWPPKHATTDKLLLEP